MKITSLSNPKIREINKLKKPNERQAAGLIVVEGQKEIELAIRGGWKIQELFICPEFNRAKFNAKMNEQQITELSPVVFKKISYRDTPDGYLATIKIQKNKKIKINKNSLLIILESVEKPGNLGAILRTADAAGVDAIILNDTQTDIFNPNVIRASRGTIFTMPILEMSFPETINWLNQNKIKIFATSLEAQKNYLEANYKKPCAIVMGAEDKGLSPKWLEAADELIKIPMQGEIDSLNVSVATAIVIFEAKRQRGI